MSDGASSAPAFSTVSDLSRSSSKPFDGMTISITSESSAPAGSSVGALPVRRSCAATKPSTKWLPGESAGKSASTTVAWSKPKSSPDRTAASSSRPSGVRDGERSPSTSNCSVSPAARISSKPSKRAVESAKDAVSRSASDGSHVPSPSRSATR
jgi:hypothetical protein